MENVVYGRFGSDEDIKELRDLIKQARSETVSSRTLDTERDRTRALLQLPQAQVYFSHVILMEGHENVDDLPEDEQKRILDLITTHLEHLRNHYKVRNITRYLLEAYCWMKAGIDRNEIHIFMQDWAKLEIIDRCHRRPVRSFDAVSVVYSANRKLFLSQNRIPDDGPCLNFTKEELAGFLRDHLDALKYFKSLDQFKDGMDYGALDRLLAMQYDCRFDLVLQHVQMLTMRAVNEKEAQERAELKEQAAQKGQNDR